MEYGATNNINTMKEVHYIIKVYSFNVERGNEPNGNTYNEEKKIYFGTSKEGVEDKLKEVAKTLTADFGEGYEVSAWSAELEDGYEEGYEEGYDILDYLIEQDTVADSEYVYHEYRSLEGAVVIEWHWETYMGYARKFECVRYGHRDEDEAICIDVDHTYKTQYSVLAWPEDLSDDDCKNLQMCLNEIYGMGKWQTEGAAERAINDMFPN